MKKKRLTIIDKSEIQYCWKCDGHGWLADPQICAPIGTIICPLCNGSGKFRESHYIYVDEVNKIAIDSDCGA
jgi:hypothetical protein